MENITFTNEAITGLIMQGVLMMILPIVLLIIWKIKTHESIGPVFVGAMIWFVFAILLKIVPGYLLLQADNPVAKTISGNIWLTMATAGILAGVFEETGRFVAFRFLLKKNNTRITSLSYGIGHGGFESVYVGVQIIMMAVIGMMLNSGMGAELFANADETTIEMALGQLGQQSKLTIGECLLGVFERIPAITAHISLSVLVFAAVKYRKYAYLFPVAIVLHALFDFSIVFYTGGKVPVWAAELIFVAFAVGFALFASRIYRKLPVDAEAVES